MSRQGTVTSHGGAMAGSGLAAAELQRLMELTKQATGGQANLLRPCDRSGMLERKQHWYEQYSGDQDDQREGHTDTDKIEKAILARPQYQRIDR